MTCTRRTLVERIEAETDFSGSQAREALSELIETIKDTLISGEDVMITGFGKFCVKEKAVRKGRNPATGDTMMLPKRRVVTFKVAKKLQGRMNTPS